METTPILSSRSSTIYVSDPRRFQVLLIFAFLAFNQCLIWLTFSPIARSTQIYYHIEESTVDLLLNWGPIIFIPCLPFTYWLLNRPRGLQRSVRLLALADFFAAWIRLIPMIFIRSSSPNFSRISMIFLHLGQIINAACGPLVMAPVSQLSCLWFAPHERTRATTLAIFANNFGSTVGFLISPSIVSSPENIPRLLYLHLALAFVACLFALLYFPSQPVHPPSAAAELLLTASTSFWNNLKTCFLNRSFLLICAAGGLLSGAFSSWTSLYDVILTEEKFTEQQAGWFGFSSSIAGIVGGLALSYLADQRRFQHSLKSLILFSLTGCALSILLFQFLVKSIFLDRSLIPSNGILIGLSTSLAGLFAGAASPLIYESLAELMYPLPESLSASILVQSMNITAVILLFLAPHHSRLINFLVMIVVVLCVLFVLFARFTYRRRDEDERRVHGEEHHETIS